MTSKTSSGLTATYEQVGKYLEGSVRENGIPKQTLWSKDGMNLEYPEWDLIEYAKKEKALRDALNQRRD